MTRSNLPLATLVLLALNVFVFVFLQAGDGRDLHRAAVYYQQVGLGQIEFPAYTRWLHSHHGDPRRLRLMRGAHPTMKLRLIESDGRFQAALHAGEVIGPGSAHYANWRHKRGEFERIRNLAFTPGHAMRYSRIEPDRMVWAMFMHGSVMHLVGNMLFLLVLGLLVEGALGPRWFLGLYLVGGIVAAFASLALHWGEYGLVLGASGAVAALMGGYCVLWGLRKVRVFYWFLVFFDYVRVPALLLLPVWLGWQVFMLLTAANARVAFGAHAAGIASGAGIALALRRWGSVRQDFIEEDERSEQQQRHESDFEEAMALIGQLEIVRARRLLEAIDAAEPGQLRVLAALYRCARYRGSPAQRDAAIGRVLACPARTAAEVGEIKALHDDYLKACAGPSRLEARHLLPLVKPWLQLGEAQALESLLRSLGPAAARDAALAPAWFTLAMQATEGSGPRRARLQYLARQFPTSDYAGKARFLLQQG